MRKLEVTELNRLTAEEFKKIEKIDLVVVLDNIRSRNNIGSIFRTADAYIVQSIYLCGITDCPPNAEIHKTALGAEQSVEWHYRPSTSEALDELRAEGYTLCAVEQAEGSVLLPRFEAKRGGKYAVVFGNEVHGVDQEALNGCDCCIELPQHGTKHSLNVSVTAGIVIWEMYKAIY